MKPKLFAAVSAALLVLGSGAANAGKTISKVGAVACVVDKWNESEPDEGHKLVDYAGRCINIPDDPSTTSKATQGVRRKLRVYAPMGIGRALGLARIPRRQAI